ncbi:MAG: cytochrome c maturation protein CcmE [Acidimicrobiales bacterium]
MTSESRDTNPGDAGATATAADQLDLTPRPDDGPVEARRSRNGRNIAIVAVIVAVLGVVVYQALAEARVYFLNVDEAVAQRDDLGDQTFRMQGTVETDDGMDETGALRFKVAYNGVDTTVVHVGDEPTSLFAIGQPVVVEGRWDGDHFRSTQIVIKHSEEYVEDNPDRIDEAVEGGQVAVQNPAASGAAPSGSD